MRLLMNGRQGCRFNASVDERGKRQRHGHCADERKNAGSSVILLRDNLLLFQHGDGLLSMLKTTRGQKKREKLRRSHKNETAVGVDPAVTHSSFLLLYRHELTPYSTLGPLLVVDFHRLPRRTHSWSSHRKPAQAAPCPACQSVALIRFRWQMPWSR